MHSYLIFVMNNSRPGSVLGDCHKRYIGGTLKLYPLLACYTPCNLSAMTLLLHLCDSIVITCYIQTVHRLALLAVKCITQRGDSAVTLL